MDHWNSLNQPKAIHIDRLEGVSRMTYSDLDDVDYLVEDNARDDFACACSQELEHFHIHQASTNIHVEDPGIKSYYHDE